jgi:hypothetical protein
VEIPCDEPDSRLGLKRHHFSTTDANGGVEDLPPFGNRRFALAAELSYATFHSRSRATIASSSAVWALVTADVTRDARAIVTSAMLVEAKPIPAVTAKINVVSQTARPTNAVSRYRARQSPAAQDDRATTLAARPTARNSHPAMSFEPKDRANQPFIAIPTPAGAKTAIDRRRPKAVTA